MANWLIVIDTIYDKFQSYKIIHVQMRAFLLVLVLEIT